MSRASEAVSALRDALNCFPRNRIVQLPTPLEPLPRLSRELGIQLYIKRDDQTGLCFGGNKSRKLEFIMADLLRQGCDTLVTWAGVQSNWCRQAAAAARRLGIIPVLVLFERPNLPDTVDGNLFLDAILGAQIHRIRLEAGTEIMTYEQVEQYVAPILEGLRGEGRKPYLAPIGGSLPSGDMLLPWGGIAYANALLEIYDQSEAQGIFPDRIVFPTSSGSTHAGLVVGAKALDYRTEILGISVSDSRETIVEYVTEIANQTLQMLGADVLPITQDEIVVFDQYIFDGYGQINERIAETLCTCAELEGVLLDPVYTGKAMLGLIDLCREAHIGNGETIIFLHTGGLPALFPYREEILKYLKSIGALAA